MPKDQNAKQEDVCLFLSSQSRPTRWAPFPLLAAWKRGSGPSSANHQLRLRLSVLNACETANLAARYANRSSEILAATIKIKLVSK